MDDLFYKLKELISQALKDKGFADCDIILQDIRQYIGGDAYQIVGYKGKYSPLVGFYRIPSFKLSVNETIEHFVKRDPTLSFLEFFPSNYKKGRDDIRTQKNIIDKVFVAKYNSLLTNTFWQKLMSIKSHMSVIEFKMKSFGDVNLDVASDIESTFADDQILNPFVSYFVSLLSKEQVFSDVPNLMNILKNSYSDEFSAVISKPFSTRYEYMKEMALFFDGLRSSLKLQDVVVSQNVINQLLDEVLDESFLQEFNIPTNSISSVMNTIKKFKKFSNVVQYDKDIVKRLKPSEKMRYFGDLVSSTSFDNPVKGIKNLISTYIDIFEDKVDLIFSNPFFMIGLVVVNNFTVIPELADAAKDWVLSRIMEIFKMLVAEVKSAFKDLFSFL